MIFSSKSLVGLIAAGWLAEALASTHGDIDAGVAAYNAGDSEAALTSYAAAEADLGERPEIHFNKGLALLAKDDKEGARKAFEHGTESEHAHRTQVATRDRSWTARNVDIAARGKNVVDLAPGTTTADVYVTGGPVVVRLERPVLRKFLNAPSKNEMKRWRCAMGC